MSNMKNVLDALPDVKAILDDVITTDEERMSAVDGRHQVDSAAETWLPKAIRPLLSIAYSSLHIYLTIQALNMGVLDIVTALATTAAIVLAIVGFYFSGRTRVKIVNMQMKAAIKVTELRTKALLKQEKKDKKLDRKARRKQLKQE